MLFGKFSEELFRVRAGQGAGIAGLRRSERHARRAVRGAHDAHAGVLLHLRDTSCESVVVAAEVLFEEAAVGKGYAGGFEDGAVASERSGKEADRWIDTLFGRFCFAVLRPSLGGRKDG